jgi:hypothetical protein
MPHRIRIRKFGVAVLLIVVAAAAALLGHRSPSSSTLKPSSIAKVAPPLKAPPREDLGRGGVSEGALPGGTTVFDTATPGVAKLDPALLGALQHAANDAARDGVNFVVDSGWRSPGYQRRLLREAIAKYGSEAEAARWVAAPGKSEHVAGNAVDLGPSSSLGWLSQHGAAYGLCQIYGNEPWHYELRPAASSRGCPAMYADPTQDPRMQ